MKWNHRDFWISWLGFVRQNLFLLVSMFLFGGIFAGVFSLYQLETEAVLYALLLCGILGLMLSFGRFLPYYRHRRELLFIRQGTSLLVENLPDTGRLLEADCRVLMSLLRDNGLNLENRWLQQRNDSIDYYTTWVHQIKTPISVMRMILQEEDTPEHQELLAELFRIEQYVEMVLCYFRLDQSSSDFVFQEYGLDDIIRQTVRKYAGQFVRRHIRLEYSGTDVRVLTDEKWLCFILEQLLSNAVKYTESGIVTISVSREKVLSVRDTGIGIAPEDLPRIFEKGFTGYNGRADKKSTGLGLYLVKRAADKLSHGIRVTSEPGKFTEVTLDLSTIGLEVE